MSGGHQVCKQSRLSAQWPHALAHWQFSYGGGVGNSAVRQPKCDWPKKPRVLYVCKVRNIPSPHTRHSCLPHSHPFLSIRLLCKSTSVLVKVPLFSHQSSRNVTCRSSCTGLSSGNFLSPKLPHQGSFAERVRYGTTTTRKPASAGEDDAAGPDAAVSLSLPTLASLPSFLFLTDPTLMSLV